MLVPQLLPRSRSVAELLRRHLVAPVLEGALGELHDVALVDQRHRRPLVVDGVLDRLAHQPLAAELADRLDADGRPQARTFLPSFSFMKAMMAASSVRVRAPTRGRSTRPRCSRGR
jgi:hypothetical protein